MCLLGTGYSCSLQFEAAPLAVSLPFVYGHVGSGGKWPLTEPQLLLNEEGFHAG